MITLYFRFSQEEHPQILFSHPNDPASVIEETFLSELINQVKDDGVYKATMLNSPDETECSIQKVADANDCVALVLASRDEYEQVDVISAQIDCPDLTNQPTAAKILANVAAREALELPPNQPSWLFLNWQQ